MRGAQTPSNMGNQETKQKKVAAASSGGGSNTAIDEGWREGGGDKTKRGKKSLIRNEGKGVGGGGGGGGGGETGTWPAKKKNKSESKSSVFSIRKRKSNLKGRSGAGSKEDVLSWQQDELDSAQFQGTKTLDLSDAEAATHCSPSTVSPKKEAGGEAVQVRRKGETVSPLEAGAPKGGSSGSDTDLYSFHSATEHEDLLADIQLAIRLQHQHNGIQLASDTREGQEGSKRKDAEGDKNRQKDGREAGGLTSSKVLQLTPELELGSDALSFLDTGRLPTSARHNGLQPNPCLSVTGAEHERGCRGELKLGYGVHGVERTQSRPEDPELSTGQKDWGALVEPTSSYPSIITAANRATAENLVSETTTRGNRLSDCPASFKSVVEPPVQVEGGSRCNVEEVQIVLEERCWSTKGCVEEESKSDKENEALTPGKASPEGSDRVGTANSVESLSDCLSAESEPPCPSCTSTTTTCVPVSQHRSLWPPQESPSISPRLRKKSLCSASSTSSLSSSVKPYPPIFPSYIKTTTRQLSSLGPSPGLSLAQSPQSLRRGHSQVHRYILLFTSFINGMARHSMELSSIQCFHLKGAEGKRVRKHCFNCSFSKCPCVLLFSCLQQL